MTFIYDPMLGKLESCLRAVASEFILPHPWGAERIKKADGSSLTEIDALVQEALIQGLHAIIPAPVLGEEMPLDKQSGLLEAGEAGLWCVDPIDGTANFANGLPYFAISAAFWQGGEPLLGAVLDPSRGECFLAKRGEGAWMNGKSLPMRQAARHRKGAVAVVDFHHLPRRIAIRLVEERPFAAIRVMGASSLDWCYVAAGRFDAFVHGGHMFWDYAAGSLILQEAGGAVFAIDGGSFWSQDVFMRSAVASLEACLAEEIIDWMKEKD